MVLDEAPEFLRSDSRQGDWDNQLFTEYDESPGLLSTRYLPPTTARIVVGNLNTWNEELLLGQSRNQEHTCEPLFTRHPAFYRDERAKPPLVVSWCHGFDEQRAQETRLTWQAVEVKGRGEHEANRVLIDMVKDPGVKGKNWLVFFSSAEKAEQWGAAYTGNSDARVGFHARRKGIYHMHRVKMLPRERSITHLRIRQRAESQSEWRSANISYRPGRERLRPPEHPCCSASLVASCTVRHIRSSSNDGFSTTY